MGLTTRDDIQLSVANEAVGARKPMVISDTKLLRDLFYRGAVFVNPTDATAIRDGCSLALAQKQVLVQEVAQLSEERNRRWLEQAQRIEKLIAECCGAQ